VLLPEYAQQKLNFYRIWSLDWPWWLWLIVVLLAAVCVIFEASYSAILKRQQELDARGEVSRPRIHAVFDWRGSLVDGCYEPLLLRNDSSVSAQRISISKIIGGDGKAAAFPLISHLYGFGEIKIWPTIENAATRNGHPDFAKFMWAAQIGEAWDARRDGDKETMNKAFMAGTALPFNIVYRDLDGKEWRTRSQVKIGGEWGSGRIVIESQGFE
jgi:hypothetical protein